MEATTARADVRIDWETALAEPILPGRAGELEAAGDRDALIVELATHPDRYRAILDAELRAHDRLLTEAGATRGSSPEFDLVPNRYWRALQIRDLLERATSSGRRSRPFARLRTRLGR